MIHKTLLVSAFVSLTLVLTACPPPPVVPPPVVPPPVVPPTPPPPTNTTAVINNQLARPINITVNGAVVRSIPAFTKYQYNAGTVSSFKLEFDVVSTTTVQGNAVGDPMGGYFSTISNPAGTYTFNVSNIIGNQFFFYPIIDNQSATSLLMVVNYALNAENRCNCVIIPYTKAGLGYFKLFTNSNFHGFKDGSGYTGYYHYWNDFASYVTEKSGTISLINTQTFSANVDILSETNYVKLEMIHPTSLSDEMSNSHQRTAPIIVTSQVPPLE